MIPDRMFYTIIALMENKHTFTMTRIEVEARAVDVEQFFKISELTSESYSNKPG